MGESDRKQHHAAPYWRALKRGSRAPRPKPATGPRSLVSLDRTAMGSLRVELGNNGPHWLMSGGHVRASGQTSVLGPRTQH